MRISGWLMSHRHRSEIFSDNAASEGKFLFATASRKSGQAHSVGWSCGEYGGRRSNRMFLGTTRLCSLWNPAPSIIRITIVPVTSSFLASENSRSATLVIAFETLGNKKSSLSPVSGQTKPNTYSHSYRVLWCASGRFPHFSHHTLRVMAWSPMRASSSAQIWIIFSGFSFLISSKNSKVFFWKLPVLRALHDFHGPDGELGGKILSSRDNSIPLRHLLFSQEFLRDTGQLSVRSRVPHREILLKWF